QERRLVTSSLLQRILYWTGGHPYLTQRLSRAVAEDGTVTTPAGADRLCEALFLSPQAQERDDNLLFVRERLLRSGEDRAGLLDLYAQVQRGKRVRDDEANPLASHLRLSGIVRAEQGCTRVRNRIYAHVFDHQWVRAHMPDAELFRRVVNQVHNETILQNWGRQMVITGILKLMALSITQYMVSAGIYRWVPYGVLWGS